MFRHHSAELVNALFNPFLIPRTTMFIESAVAHRLVKIGCRSEVHVHVRCRGFGHCSYVALAFEDVIQVHGFEAPVVF